MPSPPQRASPLRQPTRQAANTCKTWPSWQLKCPFRPSDPPENGGWFSAVLPSWSCALEPLFPAYLFVDLYILSMTSKNPLKTRPIQPWCQPKGWKGSCHPMLPFVEIVTIFAITGGDVRTILYTTNYWMQLLCNYSLCKDWTHHVLLKLSFKVVLTTYIARCLQAMVSVFGTVLAYIIMHIPSKRTCKECKNATHNTPWSMANTPWGLHHSMSLGRSMTIKTYSATMKSGC